MNKQRGYSTLPMLIIVVLWLAGIGGWVANIVKFIGMLDGPVNGWMIGRGVGIFAAPLGAVLGWL